MEYREDDFLMLSGIQHFIFCRRQWALIHIEQQWKENEHTIVGELLHKMRYCKVPQGGGWNRSTWSQGAVPGISGGV